MFIQFIWNSWIKLLLFFLLLLWLNLKTCILSPQLLHASQLFILVWVLARKGWHQNGTENMVKLLICPTFNNYPCLLQYCISAKYMHILFLVSSSGKGITSIGSLEQPKLKSTVHHVCAFHICIISGSELCLVPFFGLVSNEWKGQWWQWIVEGK